MAALVICVAAWAVEATAGDGPLFIAKVVEEQAEVYAGPGTEYYPTQQLGRGEKVDVYQREGRGWLAIRPPEGSFSWVAASQMKITGEAGIAVAAADDVEVWIGALADRGQRHRSQIRLARGERVELLGKRRVKTSSGEQVWLKIAPPAGEFRWLRESSLRPLRDEPVSPEIAARAQTSAGEDKTARMMEFADLPRKKAPIKPSLPPAEPTVSALVSAPAVAKKSAIKIIDLAPPEASPAFHSVADDSAHAEAIQSVHYDEAQDSAAPRKSLAGDGFVARRRRAAPVRSPESPRLASGALASGSPARSGRDFSSRPAADDPRRAPVKALPSVRARPVESSADFQAQLEELEVELSLMVSRPQSTWNLSALKERAAQLTDTGATPIERGQARLLAQKIQAFEDKFNVAQSPNGLEAVPAQPRAAFLADDPHYDGEGWLKEVLAPRGASAAPYALVDEEGKRICLVASLPGRSLTPYLNKKVGVYGKRGYHAELKTPHLTAERVVDLESVVRR